MNKNYNINRVKLSNTIGNKETITTITTTTITTSTSNPSESSSAQVSDSNIPKKNKNFNSNYQSKNNHSHLQSPSSEESPLKKLKNTPLTNSNSIINNNKNDSQSKKSVSFNFDNLRYNKNYMNKTDYLNHQDKFNSNNQQQQQQQQEQNEENQQTREKQLLIPIIIQKYIIELIVDDCHLSARAVNRLWRRTSDQLVRSVIIYFTDLHNTGSQAYTSETFVDKLVNEFVSLESITFINLDHNHRQSLHGVSRHLFNTYIYPFIRDVLKRSQTIHNLTIKGYPLSMVDIENTDNSFLELPQQLQTLRLKDIGLSDQSSYNLFTNTLPICKQLEELIISTHVSGSSLRLLSNLFKSGELNSLKTLKLSKNDHSLVTCLFQFQLSQCVKYILRAVRRARTHFALRELILTDNSFDTTDFAVLASELPRSGIRSLNLSENRITLTVGDELADYNSQPLFSLGSLRYLNLSKNNINEIGITHLRHYMMYSGTAAINNNNTNTNTNHSTNTIANNTNINSNNINSTSLSNSATDITTIPNTIPFQRPNQSITYLDLSYNALGSRGVKRLSKVLINNQVLSTLDVSFNRIGSEGFGYLASAAQSSRLQHLIVQSNHIDNKCASHLSMLIERVTYPFISINLSNNKIGVTGFKDAFHTISKFNKFKLNFESQSISNYQQSTPTITTTTTTTTTTTDTTNNIDKSTDLIMSDIQPEQEQQQESPTLCSIPSSPVFSNFDLEDSPTEISEVSKKTKTKKPTILDLLDGKTELEINLASNRVVLDGVSKHLKTFDAQSNNVNKSFYKEIHINL